MIHSILPISRQKGAIRIVCTRTLESLISDNVYLTAILESIGIKLHIDVRHAPISVHLVLHSYSVRPASLIIICLMGLA